MQSNKISLLVGLVLCLSVNDIRAQSGMHYNNLTRSDKFKFKDIFVSYSHPRLSRTSISAGLGLSAYTGDLSSASNLSLQRYLLNPNFGLGLNHRFTNYMSLKFEVNYFTLYSETSPGVWEDQGFVSKNIEYFVGLEIDLKPKTDFELGHKVWNQYIFFGIGRFHFDPRDPDTKVPLDKVATQQNGEQSKSAMVFPVGFGVSKYLNDYLSAGFEAAFRFTTTDFVDDASLPNDPNPRNDAYILYSLRLNFQLDRWFRYGNYLKRKRG
ncbi:hypothetical protein QQ008_20720 [Fulvivirgaceae bacterium BMA10]|uniref:Outer membrane protein beta-barrel domain-containing protein n=1 Tax=Splendidivirga corallicola TaxID=3051826 RepID=A0ABT8KST8_9BACT|nr:hypothetical protein [Fulvivirgaceae bacterium BMA10]